MHVRWLTSEKTAKAVAVESHSVVTGDAGMAPGRSLFIGRKVLFIVLALTRKEIPFKIIPILVFVQKENKYMDIENEEVMEMAEIKVDDVLDCKGLACPMPVVRTKKAVENLQAGQVLEVQATDHGSLADLKGWATRTGHQYLGSKEAGDVLHHYLRKADPDEQKEENRFADQIKNEELQGKLDDNNVLILDVREQAEYAFNHIPGAKLIPFGELEQRLDELDKEQEICVVCRTSNRSDMACHMLAEKGFSKVKNVVPGMSEWEGPVEGEA